MIVSPDTKRSQAANLSIRSGRQHLQPLATATCFDIEQYRTTK